MAISVTALTSLRLPYSQNQINASDLSYLWILFRWIFLQSIKNQMTFSYPVNVSPWFKNKSLNQNFFKKSRIWSHSLCGARAQPFLVLRPLRQFPVALLYFLSLRFLFLFCLYLFFSAYILLCIHITSIIFPSSLSPFFSNLFSLLQETLT